MQQWVRLGPLKEIKTTRGERKSPRKGTTQSECDAHMMHECKKTPTDFCFDPPQKKR